MIRVLDLFSGIGAVVSAMQKNKTPFNIVGFSEIDKFAIKSYELLYGKHNNLGDIALLDTKNIPDCDLISYGFPCQDISIAGLGKGIKHGETRSGLLYEALRIIEDKQPQYAIAENVKNLIGSFRSDFDLLLGHLEGLGYNNYWKVLNAKDYGIPQNRERVFVVSIRKDIDNDSFVFPEPFATSTRLIDILEKNVDKKYYFDVEKTESIIEQSLSNYNQDNSLQIMFNLSKEEVNDNERQRRVYSPLGIAPSLLARSDSAKIISAGYLDIKASEQIRKVYNPSGIAPTLDTMQGGHRQPKIFYENRVRKLTPRECWKLMGFTDHQFNLVKDEISDTQLYKQAGNSIVVDVYALILKNLIKKTTI
jgi:DNA (cytosine-5)-methyltransferase 1